MRQIVIFIVVAYKIILVLAPDKRIWADRMYSRKNSAYAAAAELFSVISETDFSEVSITSEQAENIIKEKIYLYEKNFTSDIEILERNIKKDITPECITYNIEYTLKGDICRENEIYVK